MANCGYMTAPTATGVESLVRCVLILLNVLASETSGRQAMQFNFVVSVNDRAVRLWQKHGFDIVGQLPKAFLHPELGYTDAYVMYREL